MEPLTFERFISFAPLLFLPAFYKLSPASKSAKLWTIFYLSIFATYVYIPNVTREILLHIKEYITHKPLNAALIAVGIAAPLKYVQQKLRYSRINGIKMKYGYTDDPASWEDMTVEQAQEIESNMAEGVSETLAIWLAVRFLQDPGVSRVINSSGHFINEDPKVEHQRMQATVHLMTAFVAYKVKSHNHSLVIARINEHHHRYGIKINSDDVLYLMIHFGMAPVPWINRFGWRKVEPFEIHAIWVLWRELACRMGVKYIPKTVEQAAEWRKNFEKSFRWREEANEIMAMAMLNQIIYPVPGPLKGFVRQLVASILDWDIVYYCRLEKLGPSPIIRAIAFDIFRTCAFLIREFGLPRLSPYQRSPQEPNKNGLMNFGHTPYDTMPFWQEESFWNLWGPRALVRRLRGLPLPSKEYQSEGVAFEAMGAPHRHPITQVATEKKVRENAAILENAEFGYRPAIGFQANRLIPPVDGPSYGSDSNTFPEGTPTTPNNPIRFTREYERRGGGFSKLGNVEKPEDVVLFDATEVAKKIATVHSKMNGVQALETSPAIMATA